MTTETTKTPPAPAGATEPAAAAEPAPAPATLPGWEKAAEDQVDDSVEGAAIHRSTASLEVPGGHLYRVSTRKGGHVAEAVAFVPTGPGLEEIAKLLGAVEE